ncbi:NAD(P)/FAD-dependent oxidoreductase [Cochlodiniinecator piscidefendens]|uniref:NAD(P)/FAD-dependent oxidoreductase n=1 Tax=Cochlodiniinecator piscidefendens TaxID=2715756 RepID=UPI00140B37EE|nr:FAD-binding oxidoreductase [Cochlodiniinecator piscidefendens]
MATKQNYDVVIVGGAVVGSAVAYFLAMNPDFDGSILIVERDPSFQHASTSLSVSGIRTQFSNPINVKISQFGLEVIRDFEELCAVDGDRPNLEFHENGYLLLAATDAQEAVMRENHAVQISEGADVCLLTQEEIKERYPHLHVDDLRLGSLGLSGEGWFNNTGLMNGFRRKARALGVDYVIDDVVGVSRQSDRITGITLASGTNVDCGVFVNCSGARANEIAGMAGLSLPVEPRKRTLFVFDCAKPPEGKLPLMCDPSGVYCRPEGNFFLSGCVPEHDPEVAFDDFEPRYDEFEEVIWPALAERAECFEAIKQVNFWAGHYAYNTLDHNVIVGPHTDVKNFIFANGFSGHGLQQGPAIGRGISEWITYGEFRALDLSELGFERVISNAPFLEKNVI